MPPFQGLQLERISKPRPMAWAELLRPFGAEKLHAYFENTLSN